MKAHLLFFIIFFCGLKLMAGNGDSIFNVNTIHTLSITFPYPNFYDSLINSHATDLYLKVAIDFDGQSLSDIGIKAKGNSSFNNPSQKKSFKLDLNEFVPGQAIHGLKKLNFNNFFKDPSFMREKVVNDFLINHQLPAPRVTYCNVYMNGQLWGLYGMVEEIDDEFCAHWFNNNDGNLFKGDPHGDLRWKGSATQSLYETEYELKNNSTANDWSDLIALINTINNTPTADLFNTLEPMMNTNNFIRQWVVMNMFSSLDAYIGSGHNYYLYHDTITNQFEWIAWDNNETFGGFKNGLNTTQLKNLDLYYLSNPASHPLCNNMLSNSTYKTLYQQAYCELKQDMSNAKLDPIIDSLRNRIQASVYADPKKFYSSTKFDSSFNYDVQLSGPGGLTVFGLKNFIAERRAAIDAEFVAKGIPCWPMLNASFSNEASCIVYPNPVNDAVHIVSDEPIEHIELVNALGQLLYSSDYASLHRVTLAFNFLPDGLYSLRINHRRAIQLKK